MTKIIGLGHYKRTGKDTLANAMVSMGHRLAPTLRIAKKSFAYKLKQVCYDLYAWDGHREPEFYETPEGARYREVLLPTIGKSPRQIWIDMGTPAVRDVVYDLTWLHYVLKNTDDLDILIIPDVRFPNEVEAVREAGGTLVKVVRPGYCPGDDIADQSLVGYDGWDFAVGCPTRCDTSMQELNYWAWRFIYWMAKDGRKPVQTPEERARNLECEKQND